MHFISDYSLCGCDCVKQQEMSFYVLHCAVKKLLTHWRTHRDCVWVAVHVCVTVTVCESCGCCCWCTALSLGETRTLIASRDEPVIVRCQASGNDHHLRWVKLTPAADVAGARRVEVSTRRRLILDADMEDRDGVYLCILTTRSSSTSSTAAARLAANVTVVSPCKHRDVVLALCRLHHTSYFLSIFIFCA